MVKSWGIRCGAMAFAVLIQGCSTAPISYYGVAPPGREPAYDCAVAELNIMGYTIEDGNRDAGFVRGRKQTSGMGDSTPCRPVTSRCAYGHGV